MAEQLPPPVLGRRGSLSIGAHLTRFNPSHRGLFDLNHALPQLEHCLDTQRQPLPPSTLLDNALTKRQQNSMGKHYHVRHRSTGERYTVTVPADISPASVRSTYEAEHWRTREISYGSGSRHDTDDFRFLNRPMLPDGLIPIDGSRCEPIPTHPGMMYPPRNRRNPFSPIPPFSQEVHSPPQRHVSFAPDPRSDPPPSYQPHPPHFTRRHGQGHSRSRSAPVNPFEGSHHSGHVSNRLAQLPEYARRHPRFEEAKYAMQMIWRYPRDDPRAVPWQVVLREITEDMERVGLRDLAGREGGRGGLGR